MGLVPDIPSRQRRMLLQLRRRGFQKAAQRLPDPGMVVVQLAKSVLTAGGQSVLLKHRDLVGIDAVGIIFQIGDLTGQLDNHADPLLRRGVEQQLLLPEHRLAVLIEGRRPDHHRIHRQLPHPGTALPVVVERIVLLQRQNRTITILLRHIRFSRVVVLF